MTRIGPSITIDGELTSDEDVRVEGRVRGFILLREAGLSIGERATIEADIRAGTVVVAGQVDGSISASPPDRADGDPPRVTGSLSADQVVLADGASFSGPSRHGAPHDRRPPRAIPGGRALTPDHTCGSTSRPSKTPSVGHRRAEWSKSFHRPWKVSAREAGPEDVGTQRSEASRRFEAELRWCLAADRRRSRSRDAPRRLERPESLRMRQAFATRCAAVHDVRPAKPGPHARRSEAGPRPTTARTPGARRSTCTTRCA
jgi:cytoskeletal protein CcmA (bactofilin family)